MIGYCLGKSLYDAAQFCLLLDTMVGVLCLWTLINEQSKTLAYDELDPLADVTRARLQVQLVAACLGLPAAAAFKMDITQRTLVKLALLLAICSSITFAYSSTSEWSYGAAVSAAVNRGQIEVSGLFWPTEWLQYLFIAIMSLNHALLAHYGREQLSCEQHKPVPENDSPIL